ncbi:hypothetical protein ACJMK2_043678 [Sinanodonta woodiana]|uniref:Nicotinamide riboside kinase 1 n=1 Tax=Sinanodonta woodiana TaxID=1069815 RepID=A0ABD3VXN5_SINWO
MSRPVLLIGISGTTNSGKTTLAIQLVQKIPGCDIIHQDQYFVTPGDRRLEYVPEVNHHNWEAYSALDMDKMTYDVKARKKLLEKSHGSGPVILLVEGFNFYGYHPVAALMDKKYFLKVSRDVCLERRRKRTYNPPDPPHYFEKVVWPMYEKHLKDIEDQDEIVYFDTSKENSLDDICRTIHSQIEKLIENVHQSSDM